MKADKPLPEINEGDLFPDLVAEHRQDLAVCYAVNESLVEFYESLR